MPESSQGRAQGSKAMAYVDLTALPKDSYWRTGVPDLIAAEADLSLKAMLDLMCEESLKIDLTIEDGPGIE